MRPKKRLGDMLVEAGLIDPHQLGAALGRQKQWGGRLGANLVAMGFITDDQLAEFLGSHLGLPRIDLAAHRPDPKALAVIKDSLAIKYSVLPVALRQEGDRTALLLAMEDPTNLEALDAVAAVTRMHICPLVTTESAVSAAIDFYYRGVGAGPVRTAPSAPPPAGAGVGGRHGDAVFDLDQPSERSVRESSVPAAPDLDRVARSGAETRAMVVVLAEMLMEQGVIDHEEFYRRYDLKKIVCQ